MNTSEKVYLNYSVTTSADWLHNWNQSQKDHKTPLSNPQLLL